LASNSIEPFMSANRTVTCLGRPRGLIQADLAKIGVKLKIEEVATAQFYARLVGGNFEMTTSGTSRGPALPAGTSRRRTA
jgi:hypothetical protein